MKYLVLAGLWLCVSFCHAAARDSTKTNKVRVVFSFDARQSFLAEKKVKIGGLKTGLEFNGKWRFGFGLYDLSSPVYKSLYISNDTLATGVKVSYIGLYAEYVFFQNKKWEFSIPLIYGQGNTRLEEPDKKDALVYSKESISLLDISVNGHYRVFRWIGIGAGFGYRYMLNDEAIIKESFDAPIYIIKIKLFVGDIYNMLFTEKKKKPDKN